MLSRLALLVLLVLLVGTASAQSSVEISKLDVDPITGAVTTGGFKTFVDQVDVEDRLKIKFTGPVDHYAVPIMTVKLPNVDSASPYFTAMPSLLVESLSPYATYGPAGLGGLVPVPSNQVLNGLPPFQGELAELRRIANDILTGGLAAGPEARWVRAYGQVIDPVANAATGSGSFIFDTQRDYWLPSWGGADPGLQTTYPTGFNPSEVWSSVLTTASANGTELDATKLLQFALYFQWTNRFGFPPTFAQLHEYTEAAAHLGCTLIIHGLMLFDGTVQTDSAGNFSPVGLGSLSGGSGAVTATYTAPAKINYVRNAPQGDLVLTMPVPLPTGGIHHFYMGVRGQTVYVDFELDQFTENSIPLPTTLHAAVDLDDGTFATELPVTVDENGVGSFLVPSNAAPYASMSFGQPGQFNTIYARHRVLPYNLAMAIFADPLPPVGIGQ